MDAKSPKDNQNILRLQQAIDKSKRPRCVAEKVDTEKDYIQNV